MKLIIISIGILFVLSVVTVFIIQMAVKENSLENPSIESRMESNKVASSTDSKDRGLYREWKWTSSVDALGEVITPKDQNKFILSFSEEGRLQSTTDCNQLGGSFIKNEEVISIGPLTSTLMGCEGETLESTYASQLSLISSYSIKNNVLTLNLLKNAGIMKFIQK